jgi:hypothetical protein
MNVENKIKLFFCPSKFHHQRQQDEDAESEKKMNHLKSNGIKIKLMKIEFTQFTMWNS